MTQQTQGRDLFEELQQVQPQQQEQQGRDLFAEMQQPAEQKQFVPFGVVPPEAKSDPNQQALAELQGGGMADALWQAFTGGDRQTAEALRTRELIEAEDLGVAADAARAIGFNLATNFDPVEIEAAIKENLPLSTIRTDQKGNKFVDINGEEFLINRPGMSKQDIGAALGNVIATFPAAKIASLGKGLISRLTGGAIAGGSTEAAVQSGQAATGGDFDAGEVAAATALGGVGELPAAIRQARMSDRARGMLPQITDAQAEYARRVRETTGVELMPNQVTGSEFDNLVALSVRRNPDQAQRFTERLRKQSSDVYAGVANLMDELATSEQAQQAANAVKRTSLEAIEQAKRVRSERTRPLYNRAWSAAAERGQVIDVSDIARGLNEQIEESTGPIRNALQKMQELVTDASQPSSRGTNVQRLHNLKRALFAERDKLSREGVLNNELARAYENVFSEVRDRLVQEVPEYDAANNLFRNLSPAVDDLSEGIIGNLSNVSDDKLKQISNLVFDWRESNANPEAIRNAKRVIQEVNPDAWTALIRNKIERDLGEIGVSSAEEAGDTTVNVLQKLYSKTFSGKDKAMLMNALDGDRKANFNALSEVIERARNRPGQSATAQLQDIEEGISGGRGVGGVISALMGGTQEMVNRALNLSSTREQNARMLANVILDPKWMDRVSEIRKMGMQTPQGGAAFAQLFRDALTDQQQEQQNGNVQGN